MLARTVFERQPGFNQNCGNFTFTRWIIRFFDSRWSARSAKLALYESSASGLQRKETMKAMVQRLARLWVWVALGLLAVLASACGPL
jgi:hypothetical protein